MNYADQRGPMHEPQQQSEAEDGRVYGPQLGSASMPQFRAMGRTAGAGSQTRRKNRHFRAPRVSIRRVLESDLQPRRRPGNRATRGAV